MGMMDYDMDDATRWQLQLMQHTCSQQVVQRTGI